MCDYSLMHVKSRPASVGGVLGIEADASFLNYLSADELAWFRTTPDTDIAEKIEFMSTVRGR